MKNLILVFILCLGFGAGAQIVVIGHNYLNNTPLANTQITVRSGNTVIQTLDTKAKAEFMLELDFGKAYQIYLNNSKCVLMHFEVIADNIPKSKYDYTMSHEFNLPFVNKTDVDVDTAVFKKPFYRIVFDGRKRMEDDTAYNNRFDASILKKLPPKQEEKTVQVQPAPPEPKPSPEDPALLTGKVCVNGNTSQPLRNKAIHALNKKNEIIKTTVTNRFGAFAFTGVKPADVSSIRLELGENVSSLKGTKGDAKRTRDNTDYSGSTLNLYNAKGQPLSSALPKSGIVLWELSSMSTENLTDNNYTSNIGGKLVSSSAKEKKFFANKNVYLSNKMNTVIKKTKTNMMGSFVFEDIKPDNTYYVGVDKTDLLPGEKIDILNKDDSYIATLDSVHNGKSSMTLRSDYNPTFNKMSIIEDEMKMDIKATIFGDNVNQPIGKLKIILLNDSYQPIDSVVTDNYGAFKFKYLPFLKRFYLSAENTENVLDVYKNILIYSGDQTLVKIMTHQKGKKFTYNPVSAELSSLRDVELEDPWLEFIDKSAVGKAAAPKSAAPKSIVENILFESNKYLITPQAREVLDKIILVLNTNKQLKIDIGAHTDNKGPEADNLKLSQMRAKTVKDYITKSGIDGSRITTSGYGETKLLNNCGDNCSEEEHARNRRIEFRILGE